MLAAATVADLRSGRVPAWLSGGGIAAGPLLMAWERSLLERDAAGSRS
jgi:hypothetical protein